MHFAAEGQVRLHRRAQRVDMAIGVSSCHSIVSFGERAIIKISKILLSQLAIALSGTTLISEEKIFCIGVGLIPGVGLVLIRPPGFAVFDSFARKMRQGHVSGVIENSISIRITDKLVGINQSTYQLVVTVSREAVVHVEIPGDC